MVGLLWILASFVLWAVGFAVFRWPWSKLYQDESMVGLLWILAFFVLQAVGFAVFHWPWSKLYQKVDKLRKQSRNDIPKRVPSLAAITGAIERLLFGLLVGFGVTDIGAFIAGWIGLKTAIGWQDLWVRTKYGKVRGIVGLWGTVVSLTFALVSGLCLRRAFLVWDVSIAAFFGL